MNRSAAEIVREYGPFPGVDSVHGVTYDGQQVWFASGDKLNAFDPASGKTLRSIDVAAHAGTAFDGQHLFQIAEDRIQKIDPKTGRVLATIPAPGGGGDSGLAWAEGTLWVGQYRDRKIHQVDPQTGAILRTVESNRFVTGVTWIDGELWHGTWEGDESDLRRVDPRTGEVLERLEMRPGVGVSGLESDGGDQFFCGGGSSGKVRTVRRPGRGSAAGSDSEIPVDSTTAKASRVQFSRAMAKPDWVSSPVTPPFCSRAFSLWRKDIPAAVIVSKEEDRVRRLRLRERDAHTTPRSCMTESDDTNRIRSGTPHPFIDDRTQRHSAMGHRQSETRPDTSRQFDLVVGAKGAANCIAAMQLHVVAGQIHFGALGQVVED
jgi:glutamine cyclotransferase